MAKITRKLQKIFAVNSASDQTTAFGSIKANSPEAPVYTKDPDAIQTTAYTNGWGDATQDDYAPYRQDMNSLQFLITRQLAYLFQAGIPEYDASTEYYANSSYCLYGGIIYKCIQDCVNKTPSNEPTYWTGYDLGTFAKINSPIFTGNPQAPTVNLADSSASIATTAFVKGNLGATSVVATGTIIPFGSASVPSGYLACDGSAISRSTYSALFSVIGTTWGTGDGSTTFNLPNLVDRYPIGAGTNATGFLTGQSLPNITGKMVPQYNIISSYSGAFYSTSQNVESNRGWESSKSSTAINFNASRSNGIYGASIGNFGTGRVIPYSATVKYIIKY